jgi:hypothetical protein
MVGWIGNAFVVAGWWFLGKKECRLGALCGTIGSAAWLIEGVFLASVSLVTLELLMVILGIRAFYILEDASDASP